MRNSIVLVIGLITVALVGLSNWFLVAGSQGELTFSPESIDLGRVPLGQNVPFRFEMRNTGSKPVRILSRPQVKALEGC